MQIKTRDFGEMEIKEENIITFDEGIFGFEASKKYVLVTPLGEENYPVWLQSVQEENLCFILYNPFEVVSDYKPYIDGLPKKLENHPDLLVLVIAVIQSELKNSSVNLKCPIVINRHSRVANQYILEQIYPMRHYLFQNT